MNPERLLICRPMGGFNDLLCQIEKACAYGDRFDRTVIVETDFHTTLWFRDRFANYFLSRQPRLVLDAAPFRDHIDGLDVFPHVLRGQVNRYEVGYDVRRANFVEKASDQLITFDFGHDYPEPVLVHHACGGGTHSLGALGRMRAHDAIVDALVRRLQAIGPSYAGIHIRNTEYQTNYRPALEGLARDIAGPVFVATDHRDALADCRAAFGAGRVHSFARLPDEAGRPPHFLQSVHGAYEINADAILDLLTLALADRIYGFRLEENPFGTVVSGFTQLAINLHDTIPVLRTLIGRNDPALDAKLSAQTIHAASPPPRSGGQ